MCRMKDGLRPTKNDVWGGLPRPVPTFLHRDGSFELLYFISGLATSKDSGAGGERTRDMTETGGEGGGGYMWRGRGGELERYESWTVLY